jgi:hypothetical protein
LPVSDWLVAGSGQYPDLRNHALPRPLQTAERSRVYPAVHIAYSAAVTAVIATAMEKTSCLRIVIIDKEPEWAIKM